MRPSALFAFVLVAGCSEPDPAGSIALALEDASLFDEIEEFVLDVHDAAGPDASVLSCSDHGELVGTPAEDPIVHRTITADGDTVTIPEGQRIFVVSGSAAGERIATGCQSERLRGGQTLDVEITVYRVVNPGECGNSRLEEGEECDDGNTAAGDGCDDACATEEGTFPQSTTATQLDPAASAGGGYFAVTWFDGNTATAPPFIKIGFRDANGQRLEGGSGNDRDANDQVAGDPNAAVVASSAAGTVVAFEDYSSPGADNPNVRAHFFGPDTRELTGNDVLAHPSATGKQDQPAAAFRSSGIALVVWRDDQLTPTGIAGRIFAEGQADGDVLDVSQGQESATPKTAATADGFLVAYVGSGIHVRPVAEDGTVGDEIDLGAASSATSPAIAGTADGASVLVAWIEGGAVHGQVIRGAAAADPFAVSTEGTPAAPVAAGGTDRFVVAWQSGGDIWARLLDQNGAPIFNRVDDDATPFELNRSTDGTQQHAGVAILGDLLLGVWQDSATRPEDAAPSGIRYRYVSIAPAR